MTTKASRLIAFCTTAVAACAISTIAQAAVLSFAGSLSGANEIPPTGAPGTGTATVIIDTVAQTMEVDVTFSGLTGNPTGAHIHCCIAQPANTIVATTLPVFPSFPIATSGTYDQILDMTSLASYNPAFVTAHGGTALSAEAALFAGIMADQTYLNIHTSLNPGGEIRALLLPTPLPAGLPLFASGLVGLGLLGWRRKRKAASA